MIKGIIIGVLIMSVLITIGATNTNNMDSPLFIFCMGPIAWILALLVAIIGKIKDIIRHQKFRGLILCPDGEIRSCRSLDLDFYARKENYSVPDKKLFKEKEHFWSKEYISETLGINLRYTPKKVWKNLEKLPDITKEEKEKNYE